MPLNLQHLKDLYAKFGINFGWSFDDLNELVVLTPAIVEEITRLREENEELKKNDHEKVQKIRDTQAIHLTTYKRPDPYFDGMYNGMELAIALILNQEPKYLGREEFIEPLV